jgi:hypothetical protein
MTDEMTPRTHAGNDLADAGAAGEGAGGADDGGLRRAGGGKPSPAAVADGARVAVRPELRVLQRAELRRVGVDAGDVLLRRAGGGQLHQMNRSCSSITVRKQKETGLLLDLQRAFV